MANAAQTESNFFESPIGHPRDRILIHENSDIPKEGQFISLNGYAFLAKPGHEIDLPRPVRLMLDTRIRTEIIPGEDGGKDFTRDIPRITYTLLQKDVQPEEEGKADPFKETKVKDPFGNKK